MRRDLERRLFDLQHSNELADRGNEKRMRKELKKLRILYRDAKFALENQVFITFLHVAVIDIKISKYSNKNV